MPDQPHAKRPRLLFLRPPSEQEWADTSGRLECVMPSSKGFGRTNVDRRVSIYRRQRISDREWLTRARDIWTEACGTSPVISIVRCISALGRCYRSIPIPMTARVVPQLQVPNSSGYSFPRTKITDGKSRTPSIYRIVIVKPAKNASGQKSPTSQISFC